METVTETATKNGGREKRTPRERETVRARERDKDIDSERQR